MRKAAVKRFLSPLWKTFYCPAFYREAAAGGASRAAVFLLFLCALCAVLFSAKLHMSLIGAMKDELPFVLAQLPEIHIADGRLSTAMSSRSGVKDPLYAVRLSGGELLAVIDETAESAPEGLGGARLYITGSDVTVSDGAAGERTYSLSRISRLSLNRETLQTWAVRAYYFAGLTMFPFLFFGLAVCRFVQAAMLSLFAYALLHVMKSRRAPVFCFSLAVHSLVPPVIAGTFVDIATGRGYIGFGLTLLFSAVIIVIVSRKVMLGDVNG